MPVLLASQLFSSTTSPTYCTIYHNTNRSLECPPSHWPSPSRRRSGPGALEALFETRKEQACQQRCCVQVAETNPGMEEKEHLLG